MPELPEVETVVRILNRKVKGLTIKKVKIVYPKLLRDDISITDFEKKLQNKKIENISRIAKYIIFELEDLVLISHLRMEGKWYVYALNDPIPEKHVEAIFYLNNCILVYRDTRKFGTFNLQNKSDYKQKNPIKKVGLEPFDANLTKEVLLKLICKSTRSIKTLLLDQSIISGIGNIYANEILFESKIDPKRKGNSISIKECGLILKNSIKILNRSIELGGSTIDTYQPEQGIDGKFQNELKVHLRANKPCFICKTKIKKIKVNGRGTYYCEFCQK